MSQMNHKHTLGKAVLVGRLNHLVATLDRNLDAFKCSPKKGKDESGRTATETLVDDMKNVQRMCEQILSDVSTDLAESTTLGTEYNKQLLDTALSNTVKEVQQAFGHQPNILATLQMFAMLFQKNADLYAHFLNLRTNCGVEDRAKGNNSAYGIDGQPNAKGRNECDHCPHKV